MTSPDKLAARLARIARLNTISPVAMLAMAAGLVKGPAPLDAEALERLLLRKANDFLALRARLARQPADPALAPSYALAARACEAGQFSELDKALAQAELQILGGISDLGALTRERRLAVGETRADRAATSQLELTAPSYREAAKRFGEAAAIIGLADAQRSHELALSQADALTRLGEDLADRLGFEAAIAQMRSLLSGLDNFDDTLRWAGAQERLALALAGLAAHGDQRERLLEAAACCRAALEDLRKPQEPALWARLQRHLGSWSLALGKGKGGDIGHIEEAVEAFQAARSMADRNRDAQGWAQLHYDLGRAQAVLGQRTGGMAHLEAAFNNLQSALEIWTRESAVALWADIQNRMGQVLVAMGQRYSEPVVLEEAVAAFGRALEERPRDIVPGLWAESSARQGLAIMQLARREKDRALAQQALAQIMAAVEATRDAGLPEQAAELQKALLDANALAQSLR